MVKKGQITIFIIIGLVLLFLIGTYLYMTRTEVTKRIEATRPSIAQAPQQIQPLRDTVESCIQLLGRSGLNKIGNTGGYIDEKFLIFNPGSPTEGEGVQLSLGTPTIAYWWYMSSPNTCENGCNFATKRPGLYRTDGGVNIEAQLDEYMTNNLRECVGNFQDYETTTGCTVKELSEPSVTANVAEEDVFFVGKYKLRVECPGQTYDTEDYYVSEDLNLKEIYTLATNVTNIQAESFILEQTTKTLIDAFSEVNNNKLPPSFGAVEIGAFLTPEFWVKYNVQQDLKQILSSYIPFIQAYGTRNYRFIQAPEDVRDEKLYEVLYNRQFYLPLEEAHRSLDLKFMYFDWWEPYLDIGCSGQVCTADGASAMIPPLFISINRYNFPYDLSYPVMVEIRNPYVFNEQGYVFRFMLEHNMRNSEPFSGQAAPFSAVSTGRPPSIFCDPKQRNSGEISITAQDSVTRELIDGASVTYICGDQLCALGQTTEGKYTSPFPRCLGGILRITKLGYQSYSAPFDLIDETPYNVTAPLQARTTLKAKIRNYALTKTGKWDSWQIQDGPPLAPEEGQQTIIQLTRNGTIYDEPFVGFAQIDGRTMSDIEIVPGTYKVSITSFLRKNITIPVDTRCKKIKKLLKTEKKCYDVPESPVKFSEESPFPYGMTEFTWTVTPEMLRGRKEIEFKQFIVNIDKIPQNQRIIEDLNQIQKAQFYGQANQDKLRPLLI